jgi:hypothetical protein
LEHSTVSNVEPASHGHESQLTVTEIVVLAELIGTVTEFPEMVYVYVPGDMANPPRPRQPAIPASDARQIAPATIASLRSRILRMRKPSKPRPANTPATYGMGRGGPGGPPCNFAEEVTDDGGVKLIDPLTEPFAGSASSTGLPQTGSNRSERRLPSGPLQVTYTVPAYPPTEVTVNWLVPLPWPDTLTLPALMVKPGVAACSPCAVAIPMQSAKESLIKDSGPKARIAPPLQPKSPVFFNSKRSIVGSTPLLSMSR